jgi:hypothetical protein
MNEGFNEFISSLNELQIPSFDELQRMELAWNHQQAKLDEAEKYKRRYYLEVDKVEYLEANMDAQAKEITRLKGLVARMEMP